MLPFETASQGKYVLYIGTNDKDTYTQQIPLEQAETIVSGICSKYRHYGRGAGPVRSGFYSR